MDGTSERTEAVPKQRRKKKELVTHSVDSSGGEAGTKKVE